MRPALAAFAVLALAGCAHAPPPPPPPPDAAIAVQGGPGAQLFIDDAYAGPATGRPLALRSGRHRIEVRADGMFPAYREVTLAPGERRALEVPLRPDLDASPP